ncbi:unnamed protein product [Soboliphyme baturini]|uniref:Uncharacterized protein n=1 Tax=Soboliphyme baturini TaxID=241478 RepID=A0A183J6L6_9BILA|nr:unnamed protein product [Soboliphyme baturini]
MFRLQICKPVNDINNQALKFPDISNAAVEYLQGAFGNNVLHGLAFRAAIMQWTGPHLLEVSAAPLSCPNPVQPGPFFASRVHARGSVVGLKTRLWAAVASHSPLFLETQS